MATEKTITFKKGKQYHLPNDISYLEKYQVGKMFDNFGEENQDLKKLGRGRISSCRELYTVYNTTLT